MMFFGTVISFVLFLSLQSALSFSPKSIRRNEVVFNREKLHDRLSSLRAGAVDLSLHDAAISILVASESIVWLKVWTSLATNGFLDSKITRKIIHTGSAPLFIAHWPLYSNLPTAKYFAAAVPLIQVLRLCWAGLRTDEAANETVGQQKSSSELVRAVSRTGSKAEALGGPLIYSIVLLLGTLLYFRESAIGIVAISQMAAGDGVADIFGRKYGKTKWPFAPTKSVVGSCAFVVGGFLVTAALLWLMNRTGLLNMDVVAKLPAILLISVLSAMAELIPGVDDNISVPAVAAILAGHLL